MTTAPQQKISPRTPWQVTKNVWWALFVRETLQRTMADRLGWFWLFAQPALIVVVFVVIRAVIMQGVQNIAGAELIPWLIVGLLTFQIYRETTMRSLDSVGTNKQLFSYRQIKPIDPVFVRCFIEGVLNSFILLFFIILSPIVGIWLIPHDPVSALFGWFSIWMIGVGGGLINSVGAILVPEIRKIVPVTIMPLFLISGVLFPLNFLPADLLQYLLLNPLIHGIEYIRAAFFENYQPVKGIDIMYLWYWGLGLLAIGLLLHIRFEQKMKER